MAIEATMEAIKRDLRAYRNSKPPVHKLSHELLAIVMEMVIYPTRTVSHIKPSTLLATVCQRWRHVATSDAWLWTCIRVPKDCLPNSDAITTYFLRSKTVPITISFPEDSYDYLRWLKFLMLISSRIQGFKIKAYVSHNSPQLLAALPLPNVEELILTSPSMGVGDVTRQLCCQLPMPKLKSLVISHFTTWPNEIFSNLSRLGLYQHDLLEDGPPMLRLLEVLDLAQSLEELGMNFVPVTDDAPVTRFVTLPLLSKLELQDCHPREFLSHLHLPSPNTKILINTPEHDARFGSRHDLLQKLPEDCSQIVALNSIPSLVITLVKMSVVLSIPDDASKASLCIVDDLLENRFDGKALFDVMAFLTRYDVLSSIRSLTITNDFILPVGWEDARMGCWEECFERWNNLECLFLTDCCVDTIFDTLDPDAEKDSDLGDSDSEGSTQGGSSKGSPEAPCTGSERDLLCLRLHTLSLKLTPPFASCRPWAPRLAIMLRSRHREGSPIRTLHIELPPPETGKYKTLSKDVVQLILGLRDYGVENLTFIYDDQKIGMYRFSRSYS